MASILTQTIAPDMVISFEINPGTLLEFLDSRAEGGPRLKCFEGSVTLVSPGKSHETMGSRLDLTDLGHLSGAQNQALGLGVDHLDIAVRGRGHRVRGGRCLLHPEPRDRRRSTSPPTLPSKSWSPTRRRRPCGPGRS